MEMDIIDEQVDTVGRASGSDARLCLATIKFDPIPASDYYGLAGISEHQDDGELQRGGDGRTTTGGNAECALRTHDDETATYDRNESQEGRR